MRKGIILAGGSGTRLKPLTLAVNKQLLPVYDKPMIYYPLSTIMKAGIREVLIIVGSEFSQQLFSSLLGDGSKFGINLTYQVQEQPNGIAEAFILGEEFIGKDNVALALGDNIFYSHTLDHFLRTRRNESPVIFGCEVADPRRYGVAVLDEDEHTTCGGECSFVAEIEEKPAVPKSNLAVPGLYFYDSSVVERAKNLEPSYRGELEITDLSRTYIDDPYLELVKLEDAFWFDCGTHDSLLEAAQFIQAAQSRTGKLIGDPQTVAQKNGWI